MVLVSEGELDGEPAAFFGAFAVGLNGSAVCFDDLLDECESDSKSFVGSFPGLFGL